jgi:glycosyltransferase involved in cell wall biosynthesis
LRNASTQPDENNLKYFLVVQAPGYPLSADRFALESAFAVHLRKLRELIGSEFEELVMIGPALSESAYRAAAPRLDVLDVATSGVRFLPAFQLAESRGYFLLHRLLPMWRWLKTLFAAPCVVHAGLSTDLARPLMFMASLAARRMGRPVIFIVDMDFRQHARRFYKTGMWSLKSYLASTLVYDPLKGLQLRLAPRLFQVCCLKGGSLVRDFGRGHPNVHNFYDTVHSERDVLNEEQLQSRIRWLESAQPPLRVVYFGRLAANKGVDRMIAAIALARSQGTNVCLRVIGTGECLESLRAQARASGLEEHVEFLAPVAYGEPLFRLLADCHACVAAPLIEDTPRAAFDAFSRGLPIIAFDIAYFRDLARASSAVLAMPWPQVDGLADALIHIDRDRVLLGSMARSAVNFAARNTQDIWLQRRLGWLRAAMPQPAQ